MLHIYGDARQVERNRGRNGKVSVVVARFRVEHDVALASLLRFEGGDHGRYNERHDGYI